MLVPVLMPSLGHSWPNLAQVPIPNFILPKERIYWCSYYFEIFDPYAIIYTYANECPCFCNILTWPPLEDLDDLCTVWASPFCSAYESHDLNAVHTELRLWANGGSCPLQSLKHFVQRLNMLHDIPAHARTHFFIPICHVGSLYTNIIEEWQGDIWNEILQNLHYNSNELHYRIRRSLW